MSAWLERRIAEISAEIRHYPGPIARCDQQLAALLDERSRLMSRLEKQTCSAEALWVNDGGFNAA
jgi:hypothetical protein